MTEQLRLALEKRKQLRQELGEEKWNQLIDDQFKALENAWSQLLPCVVEGMTEALKNIIGETHEQIQHR